jgi:pimeloyl-ACP methyl ester carboxylesterase
MPDHPWTAEGTVDADGTTLYHREVGSGPPILLLHGFPQTGHCWRLVAPKLATEHRVLVPDLPGYGRSARPPAFDVATLARTLVAFLDAVGEPTATVVGHDWGGAVAFRLASAHAERVERLVVVNSPYRRLDLRRGWHMLAFNVPVLPELAFTLAGDRIIDWMLRAASVDASAFDRAGTEPYRLAYRGLERQRSALAYYRTISRQAVLRALPNPLRRRSPEPGTRARGIDVPTMIVWGMKDPVMPPALLDGIAHDIPQARIERVEDAGHFVPEERPDRLADLILGFSGGQLSLL